MDIVYYKYLDVGIIRLAWTTKSSRLQQECLFYMYDEAKYVSCSGMWLCKPLERPVECTFTKVAVFSTGTELFF